MNAPMNLEPEVMDSDLTAAAGVPEEPLTTAADPAVEGETQSINAWSLEDASTDVTPYRQRSWKIPGIVAAVVVAVVAGVGIWWELSRPTPAPPVASMPHSVAPQPIPAPAPPQTPDQRFVSLMKRQGFVETGTDAQVAQAGRQVCANLTSGRSNFAQVVNSIETGSGVSHATATRFAETAIDVYCPEYQGAP